MKLQNCASAGQTKGGLTNIQHTHLYTETGTLMKSVVYAKLKGIVLRYVIIQMSKKQFYVAKMPNYYFMAYII